jgi:zinc D-Ala-D-Ala carboxypeptidase
MASSGGSSRGRTGSLSPHFTAHELACPHCGVCVARDFLISRLERLRAIVGRPIPIVSGYRCPVHNLAAGGATNSQHMYGAASDIPAGIATAAQARGAGFIGIGTKGDYAIHVDVRDGGPAAWRY